MAIGLSKVREAIASGNMDIPREFQAVADSIADPEASDNEASIFPFLAWMIDHDKPGASGAAQAFKAINQRKAWVRAHLGESYADPMNVGELVKRFAPDGFVAWQPDEGKLLYTAKSLPEHVMDRMLERIAAEEDAFPAGEMRDAFEQVRSLLGVGGQMVLPEELAETLNSIRDEHADNVRRAAPSGTSR